MSGPPASWRANRNNLTCSRLHLKEIHALKSVCQLQRWAGPGSGWPCDATHRCVPFPIFLFWQGEGRNRYQTLLYIHLWRFTASAFVHQAYVIYRYCAFAMCCSCSVRGFACNIGSSREDWLILVILPTCLCCTYLSVVKVCLIGQKFNKSEFVSNLVIP